MKVIEDGRCYHCGRKIKRLVQLELNAVTGLWTSVGWEESESQGWFDFGSDCAANLDDADAGQRDGISHRSMAAHRSMIRVSAE